MRLGEIDLTGEEYKNYSYYGFDDIFLIKFSDTEITIDSREFDKLKEDIIKTERLVKVFNVASDDKEPPKREILLKELTKTIDRITDLTNRYDSKYYELMKNMKYHTFKEDLEVKNKLLPIWRERNKLMNYKEKLEAQLKYGGLQGVCLKQYSLM